MIFRATNALTPGTIDRVDMKFNQALLLASLLPLLSCYRQAPCERTPGQTHSYTAPRSQAWSQGAPGQRINTLATSPGPDWMWLDGCWYWNDEDWVWLSQQWMPPGGSLTYMGPEGSGRDDYCVYTPDATYPVASTMLWPPDVNYGRTTQYIVVHGDYGTRQRQGWHDSNLPPSTVRSPHVRDHRRPGRRNEVVPSNRGKRRNEVVPSDRGTPRPPRVGDRRDSAPVIDLVAPPARPPAPTGPRVDRRPKAPSAGPVGRPRPPVIHRPTRPTGPRTKAPSPGRAAPPRARPSAPPRGQRPAPPRSPSPPKASSPRPSAPPAGRARPPARSAPRPAAPPSRGSRPSPRSSGKSSSSSRRPR